MNEKASAPPEKGLQKSLQYEKKNPKKQMQYNKKQVTNTTD